MNSVVHCKLVLHCEGDEAKTFVKELTDAGSFGFHCPLPDDGTTSVETDVDWKSPAQREMDTWGSSADVSIVSHTAHSVHFTTMGNIPETWVQAVSMSFPAVLCELFYCHEVPTDCGCVQYLQGNLVAETNFRPGSQASEFYYKPLFGELDCSDSE